ncbi:MAG: NYN domain-containing protein [Erythrobacter sp.]
MNRGIAIMIDGGFVSKRLSRIVERQKKLTPKATCGIIRSICRKHVQKLTGDDDSNWHRHVYRIFYYDAPPFEGQAHHPVSGKQINFKKSDQAAFQQELFQELKKQRNMALRLGSLSNISGWKLDDHKMFTKLLRVKPSLDGLVDLPRSADGSLTLDKNAADALLEKAQQWAKLEDWMVKLDLRQKGVDMRIGLDIASVTLKQQAHTIVLISGDADFVPAAKLARREGVQFILDPLWQKVSEDLFEHIDGLQSVMARPGEVVKRAKPAAAKAAPETGVGNGSA